jgi:DNA topoisomerase I
MSTLVIVESPTKARTIRNYLPAGYKVEASMGHVRDLPQSASEIPAAVKAEKWAQLGVNVDADFEPLYVVPKDKKKIVTQLKDALKGVTELILATDEDREGESISWHLYQLLNPKIPTKRMVFHEITKEAIQKALKNCRTIDEKVVRAQETRRILDRLVGYTLSPLLWKKISFGLSAGRVQSVAVRLLVTKERQRRVFRTGAFWDLKASLLHNKTGFSAVLVSVGGTKVATGSDFDSTTGQITAGRNVMLLKEAEAEALKARLGDKAWSVTDLEERPVTRKPYPPFTTSTLQQEANRKLRFSARDTMRIAQNLYEQGYITYMRTDSVHLSDQAVTAARECAAKLYGKEYLSPSPRQYTTKSKGAQEAHEAIRPAGSSFRTPQETGLNPSDREFKLYDLIWKRTVACQMADARQTQITIQMQVEDAGFRSSGKRIDFEGYLRAYVEGSDDPDAALENMEIILPNLKVGDKPECTELENVKHETQPPARYTEASLVKTLESEGIGRPSTYASIIGTIIDKGYAQLTNNALIPTFTAFAVTDLLEKHFPDIVDPSFTSKMEQTLDDIAAGEAQWLPYLRNFYMGEKGLETLVREQEGKIDKDAARTVDLQIPNVKVRIGKFGAYLEASNGEGSVTASIPRDLTPADLDLEKVQTIIRQKTEGPDEVGRHPETGEPIYLKIGTYGPYVQMGDKTEENPKPKQTSLPKGVTPETLTLEIAVGLLALPRTLGNHPDTGGRIQTSLGRFGPYVVHDQGKEGKDYRSLKSSDNVLTVNLERALEILSEPKKGRASSKSKAALRELGVHPDDEQPINIYDGPYGPYIKYAKTNVSIPEGSSVEDMTLEVALELLASKSSSGKSTRKTASKSKETTTKKSTTKSTTTKASSQKSAKSSTTATKKK